MTIRTRLALGIVAIVAVLAVPIFLAIHSLERLAEATAALRDREFAGSLLVGRIGSGIEDLRAAETALLFVHDSSTQQTMSQQVARLTAMTDSLEGYALDSAARSLRADIRAVAENAPLEYRAASAGAVDEAERISTQRVVPAIARMERSLSLAERSLRTRTRARVEAAADRTDAARRLSAFALVAALGIALVIGVWLTRSISRPVRDLERGMEAVADGNFGHRLGIRPDRRDEFGRLAESFQSMATQLTALDRLKAEFVSVASHELKTPINVILGYLQLLQEGTYGELTERQREICATLETQARSLARLVKQLLDVSRFEAGGGKLELRYVDLRRFLGDLETAFQVLSLQRGITLRVELVDGIPEQVCWDADRINEVLGNLLSNAFKFTDPGGTIELHVEPADGAVRMEVRDTGAGIPPAQLPHIFRKFYQADNQDAAAAGGTGLGLAIAKEIVEAHHGTIEVDSTLGVGTTFIISLPAQVAGRRTVQETGAAGTAVAGAGA